MKAIQVFNQSDRIEAELIVKSHSIQVVSKSYSKEFTATDLILEMGGNNQKLLFLKSRSDHNFICYLEPNFQDWTELENCLGLAESIKQVKSHQKSHLARFWLGPLVIILLFAALLTNRGAVAGALSGLISFSTEKKLGDQIFKPKRTAEQQQIEKELQDLISQIKFQDVSWNNQMTFHISSETEANAYATIGGHIFINKGLITSVDRPEDLLGVVAHEMIHVKKRHVVKSVMQGLGVFTVLSVLFGDFTGLAAVLADQGAPILNLSYSRELEEEADREAVLLLAQSGIDPIGLANSLQVIFDQQKKLLADSPAGEITEKLQKIEILNSHPETEKRIAGLKTQAENIRQQYIVKPLTFEYENFKSKVKDHF